MPKRVFVCSPLRAPTSEGYAKNLQIARELTRAVLLAGHAPYTPHLWYTSHLDDSKEDQRKMGMAAGASWLRVADEIWVYAVDESECSSGMKAEILAASRLSLPVRVVWMPDCFAEVRAQHVADRAGTFDRAVAEVKRFEEADARIAEAQALSAISDAADGLEEDCCDSPTDHEPSCPKYAGN